MRKVKLKVHFPKDESKHNLPVEWWYFNGNLKDRQGNKYAFMKCLFKVDPLKSGLSFLGKGMSKEVYFSHSLICDIKNQKFYSNIHPVVNVAKESFNHNLDATYTIPLTWHDSSHKMEKLGKNRYHLVNEFIDLQLKSKTKPLLEAETGFITLKTEYEKTSYYYSLPDLEISGKIFLDKKPIEVSGQGWMDHQWSDTAFNFDKWNWFSIQLEDRTNLMCVEYGQKTKDALASIMYADGSTFNTRKVKIKPGNKKWTSQITGASYPLEWNIEIPEEKIKLKANALIENPEINFGIINYWEGPMIFSGTHKGKKIKGRGFMELVGYSTKKGNAGIIENEVKKYLKNTWRSLHG